MAWPKISCSELYEHDYYAWVGEQVRALRGRRLEDIDFENVAEEIEDLGKSEKRSVQSHLETLIEHLLKLSSHVGFPESATRDCGRTPSSSLVLGSEVCLTKVPAFVALSKDFLAMRTKVPEFRLGEAWAFHGSRYLKRLLGRLSRSWTIAFAETLD